MCISKDAHDQRKVWFVRIMHEEADLLDGIGLVWMRQGEVLESTRKTPVL